MEQEITLKDIFEILKRRIKLMLLIFFATVFVTGVYLVLTKPTYEVTATIKLPKEVSSSFSLSPAETLLGLSVSSPAVEEQIELMKSRKVLGAVVEELNLVDYFSQNSKVKLSVNQAIDALSKVVSAEAKKNTSLIQLAVSMKDKEMAYKIASSLIKNYIIFARELNKDENSYLLEFVEKQLPIVEKELLEIEEKVQQFQKTKSILPSAELEALIKAYATVQNNVVDTQLNLQRVQTQISTVERNIAQIKGLIGKASYVPDSSKLQQLRSELVNLEIQYSSLRLKYTEDSQEVRTIKQEIETIQQMIKDEITRILAAEMETEDPILRELYTSLVNLQTEKEALTATLKGLQEITKQLDEKLKQFPELQREYAALQRDYTIKQQTYSLLRTKREELRLSTAGMGFNLPVVLDEPFIPEKPAKPNKKLTLAIGGVLGIFLSVLAAFVREATDKTVHSEDQIRFLVGNVPIIAKIPTLQTELVTLNDSTSTDTEAFKLAALNASSTVSKPAVIAVTSPAPKDGRTLTAANLAAAYAKFGFKTLLVDLDMRNPRLEQLFNVDSNSGLSECVLKDLPLENAITRLTDNFDLLSSGDTTVESTKIISSSRLREIIEKLKNRYDIVVLDTPALTETVDALIMSKLSDGIVLLVREGQTSKEDLKVSVENLQTHSVRILGIILNGWGRQNKLRFKLKKFSSNSKKNKSSLNSTNVL